jgi:hypothetical protein
MLISIQSHRKLVINRAGNVVAPGMEAYLSFSRRDRTFNPAANTHLDPTGVVASIVLVEISLISPTAEKIARSRLEVNIKEKNYEIPPCTFTSTISSRATTALQLSAKIDSTSQIEASLKDRRYQISVCAFTLSMEAAMQVTLTTRPIPKYTERITTIENAFSTEAKNAKRATPMTFETSIKPKSSVDGERTTRTMSIFRNNNVSFYHIDTAATPQHPIGAEAGHSSIPVGYSHFYLDPSFIFLCSALVGTAVALFLYWLVVRCYEKRELNVQGGKEAPMVKTEDITTILPKKKTVCKIRNFSF